MVLDVFCKVAVDCVELVIIANDDDDDNVVVVVDDNTAVVDDDDDVVGLITVKVMHTLLSLHAYICSWKIHNNKYIATCIASRMTF